MDIHNYNDQLQLIARALPLINWDKFSLKGGSAINLFFRPLPRISVDIDLNYRFISNRQAAIGDISSELRSLYDKVNHSSFAKSELSFFKVDPDIPNKVYIESGHAGIKIEPNFIQRGSVFEDSKMQINPAAADLLGINKHLSATVMSFEDVYAGKICAALDRQHPRDLYDIQNLLSKEGISEKTKDAFLIYLCSNNRTISELLNPNLIDVRSFFDEAFSGTTLNPFSYYDYEKTRNNLIEIANNALTFNDQNFLLSFSDGNPQWNLLSKNLNSDRIQSLPSIQWKLLNISKMDNNKKTLELDKINSIFKKNIRNKSMDYGYDL